jgi:hypothetical protein
MPIYIVDCVHREPVDRDEITHVDLEAQFPPCEPMPKRKRKLTKLDAFLIAELLLVVMLVARGCG